MGIPCLYIKYMLVKQPQLWRKMSFTQLKCLEVQESVLFMMTWSVNMKNFEICFVMNCLQCLKVKKKTLKVTYCFKSFTNNCLKSKKKSKDKKEKIKVNILNCLK